VQYLELAKEY